MPVTRDRYQNVPREERICDKYDPTALGDEYHVISVCNNQVIEQVRYEYIPQHILTVPNRSKFHLLMQWTSIKILKKLEEISWMYYLNCLDEFVIFGL